MSSSPGTRQRDYLDDRDELSRGGIPIRSDSGGSSSANPDMERLMTRYQQADSTAAAALVDLLSPQLCRFFGSQMGSRTEAEDMLQDVWLRIHRMRHTYRPGEPVLPWVYAIARRERSVDALPEPSAPKDMTSHLPPFEEMMAALPASQREVLTMLKVNGLSVEEVARATSSTAGAVKQKAHRAYRRLRDLLERAPVAQPVGNGVAR